MKRQLILEGREADGASWATVRAPWDGRALDEVAQASHAQAMAALAFAEQHRAEVAAQSTGKRRDVLLALVEKLKARRADFEQLLCDEAGKPIAAAKVEVSRAIETFSLAAAALQSFGGEVVPVDFADTQAGAECEVRRVAAGIVVGIVPFNFPLNLGAHKVAPALAVGAPILVKPPHQAPSAQLLLGQLALEAGAHPAAIQVLPCPHEVAEAMATDPRVRVLSFTGSAKAGWHLKSKAAGKVVLELGGNAAAIVARDADLELAAKKLAVGAFTYAGQVCIKVQRILVEQPVWDAFQQRFLQEISALQSGDPADAKTVIGPVIDDKSAERITEWIDEAMRGGARSLVRRARKDRLLGPCVLVDVPKDSKAWKEEIFGPVVCLKPVADFDEALREVNDSAYGLQAGVFTRDWRQVRKAFHTLDVGGLIVDDAPGFRSDNQPYGGNKGSGLGREGVRYAMEDFTEPRALIWRR